MVDRKISKGKLGVAFLITLMVFSIGVLLGLLMDEKRLDYMQEVINKQNLEYNSLQTQYLYVGLLADEKNCAAIVNIFEKNLDELGRAQKRFEAYNSKSSMSKESFNEALRDYLLSQIRYWMLAKKTKEVCNVDSHTILYFYINGQSCTGDECKDLCGDCDAQAFILDYLKKTYGEKVLIFSFNLENANEPMVAILKDSYNITKYPTIVVDDKKFEGLTSKEEIVKEAGL